MVLQLQKRRMALAGVIMTSYLVFHMLTNLSFFSEPAFTAFYQFYNTTPIRWLVLIIFVVTLAIHLKIAIKTRQINAKARPVNYAKHDKRIIPAFWVTVSLLYLLIFIVVHIVQTVLFDTNSLYNDMIALFQSPLMVLFYLSGLFVLMMHLAHSLANVLQTLAKTPAMYHRLVWTGVLILTSGFISIPLYVYFMLS